MIYTLTVKGEPVPQGRPRFSRQRGKVRTHTPPKSDAYKRYVQAHAARIARKPLEGALKAEIIFYLPIMKSWPKYRKEACLNGEEHHTSKPDCDNLAKAVLDGCNGILFKDDSQIVRLVIEKRYSEEPRFELKIEHL